MQLSANTSGEITKESSNSNNDEDSKPSLKEVASSIRRISNESIDSTKIALADEQPNSDEKEPNNSIHENTKNDTSGNMVTEPSKANEAHTEVVRS